MYDYRSFTIEMADYAVAEFLDLYSEYNIQKYEISDFEQVVVIEDSAIIYIKIDYHCEFQSEIESRNRYMQDGVCGLDFEELTKNNILSNYNHSQFLRNFEAKYNVFTGFIRYARFYGVKSEYLANNMESHAKYIDSVLPEIKLQDRLNAWKGDPFNIVVYEMEDLTEKKYYAVDAIRGKVHPHVLKVAERLVSQPYDVSRVIGFGLADIYQWIDPNFIGAFQSYKNERKVKRLEEHFTYFSIGDTYFEDLLDIRPFVIDIANRVKKGDFSDVERTPYLKPEYKWKTEELVYKIIKKQYKNSGVIYQHRPHFLKSSFGGQMSYDVYISDLQVAVEYQGKQHFEPIDYFGGEEAFRKLQQRDLEKAQLSKQHNIKIVYVNYWEDVTPELIRSKITDVLQGMNNLH